VPRVKTGHAAHRQKPPNLAELTILSGAGEDADAQPRRNGQQAAPRQAATLEMEKVNSPFNIDHKHVPSSKILDEAMLSPQMLKDITQMQDAIKSRLHNNTTIAWSLKRRE